MTEREGFLERLGKRLDNMNVWHKRIAAVIGTIGAIAGVVIGISNSFNATLDEHISAQTSEISDSLDGMEEELRQVRLDTLRTQLFYYISHEPAEINNILEIAKVYFVDYKGDWIATNKFKKWADEYSVEVPFELNH